MSPRRSGCDGSTTSSTIASPIADFIGDTRSLAVENAITLEQPRPTSKEFLLEERARAPILSPTTPKKCRTSPARSNAIIPIPRASSTAGFDVSSTSARPTETGSPADDLDQRDQGGVRLRASHGEGNAEPLADAGDPARLLSRFRDLDDGGGARARLRRPIRLRLSLRARPRYRRRASRRRLDACVVPDLSARRPAGWNSIRPTASSAIAISFAWRLRVTPDRQFPFTAPIAATREDEEGMVVSVTVRRLPELESPMVPAGREA